MNFQNLKIILPVPEMLRKYVYTVEQPEKLMVYLEKELSHKVS